MHRAKLSSYFFERLQCRSFLVAALCTTVVGCQSSGNSALSKNADDSRNRFYAGASFGQSRLSPETNGTDYRIESASAMGTQLRVGYDLHKRIALELDTALLGSSALGEANTGVEYSAATASVLIYGLGGVQVRSRREGLSAFARLGYGQLRKVSIIEDFDFSGNVPIIGLGAEYGLTNGLGIRMEVTRFDADVSYAGMGAIFRFGASGENNIAYHPPAIVEQAPMLQIESAPAVHQEALGIESPEILLGNEVAVISPIDSVLPLSAPSNQAAAQTSQWGQDGLADRWRPAQRSDDSDSDGVLDRVDACPNTQVLVTVGRDGCGLFDQVLSDVTFTKGSPQLNSAARTQLDQVAQTLLAFPESRIQIKAHTDSGGSSRGNTVLSENRAIVVSQFLRSRGVNQNQLQTIGMGEALPIADNDTAAGRIRNRRVELVTLPDLDAAQFIVDEPTLRAAKKVSRPLLGTSITKAVIQTPLSQRLIGHPREKGYLAPEKLAIRTVKSQQTSRTQDMGKLAADSGAEPALLSAEVVPLPVPGFYPGLDIGGVIEGVEFKAKTSVLTEQGMTALEPIAKALRENPTVAIAVMAHTDNEGGDLENEKLTVQRADAVIAWLVGTGISRDRLQGEGYGERLPLIQNLTDEDRSRNRRVEIRVLPSQPKQ